MSESFDKWCAQLLDTGKSNKLINFKESKLRTLEILSPDPDTVFRKLRNGNRLSFYDVDEFLTNANNNQYFEIDVEEKDGDKKVPALSKAQIYDLLNKRVRATEVLSYKKGCFLRKVLLTLKKLANETLTEKGINILYMAFGFLKWRESIDSKIWFISPLNLVPIALKNTATIEPFYVMQYEDEVTTNPTLTLRLKSDFGIELPDIGDDENLCEHLSRIQDLVKSQDWEVIATTYIGTFSFHKINMYSDLKDNESKIIRNDNVSRLLGEKSHSESLEEAAPIEDYFKLGRELNLHNVVDADSSQIEAIAWASAGKNMVLQGPPGTGKSQTITNLIAEFLCNGKKVLFVSEKLAALKVVSNNLEKAGLSDFYLELHSNKTNKKDVIEELFRTLCLDRQSSNVDKMNEELTALLNSKRQLDDYALTLHEKQPVINRSPYEILGEISKFRSTQDFEYVITGIEKRGVEHLSEVLEVIFNYQAKEYFFGSDFRESCYFGYTNTDTSFQKRTQAKRLFSKARDFLKPMCELAQDLNDAYSFSLKNLHDIDKANSLLSVISNLTFFDNAFFNREKLKTVVRLVTEITEIEESLEKKRRQISSLFELSLFTLEIDSLLKRFERDYHSKLRFLKSSYRKDMLELKTFLTNSKSRLNYKTACQYLKLASECIKLQDKHDKCENSVFTIISKEAFLGSWQTSLSEMIELRNALVNDELFFQSISRDEFFRIKNDIGNKTAVYEAFNKTRHVICELQKDYADGFDLDLYNISEFSYKMEKCTETFEELFDYWLEYINIINKFRELDLYDFIENAIDAQIPIKDLDKTFVKMFYTQWFLYLKLRFNALGSFSRASQDKAVESFSKRDKLKFKISQAQIVSKLSSMRPNASIAAGGGQVSALQREAQKKRKQMPVRVLLKSIPELIQTLKPCFMMSPLSVSTYLSEDKIKFDVVIFDEASQIFPWDAIGAIYRAKQVIVIGDSKQMPPSNFFNAGIEDDSNEDDYEDDALDFESILDLCSATFEQKSLRWHYRSRVEELIAFSNHNFYQGALVSFPSNKKGNDDGVSFHFVKDGIFDRKTRSNVKEAEKIVELIFEHFENTPKRSLGIVGFSIAQQTTIENVLQKYRTKDDRFAEFFEDKLNEPFFIKNLETIQGDERDTIIFSVGYAKDSEGKFLHNFGPLNRRGGERRLNVAITRAKYNVKVVSSIRSFDIDLSKAHADGARLLKEYLDFAERGVVSLNSSVTIKNETEIIQGFENEVLEVLKSAGYNVKSKVGCSVYKIDIAVRDTENDSYVLAVECDGLMYKFAKTTRDRDRLRQEVLERLGWRFYRIWSTEWIRNKALEKRKLLEHVENALKNFNKCTDGNANIVQTNEIDENTSADEFTIHEATKAQDLREVFIEYKSANIEELIKKQKDNRYNARCAFLEDVIRIEGPIMEELLLKKVVRAFGREKVTSVVREEFNIAIKGSKVAKKTKSGFWTIDNGTISLRIPREGEEGREILMICIEEIADGLEQIIRYNVGISKEWLFKTISNLLGYARLGESITQQLEIALELLIKSNKITEKDGQYLLFEKALY
ncbi:MAG: DUF4011 domain-containing protein [Elusimicrobiota bacterium]|jgi:very-short-patch-repair endonuclease|nr:DUF4011 domain-containing protein [Elusimicrobiota bacterium]